ncbi:hypothetical protein [Bradyrhizobium cytisi]|uniref:Uncharacterized protein n=1 Tax=Bradyrhizobium cytisi TaxID=515489 RepID=A0A5S4XEM9_9BRAD|nr:hypothetical protein [Bradyrhizobium cytisi]TYL87947.1 hypothetical protein FXB38_02125 [Bradyrhizobium cytisi]
MLRWNGFLDRSYGWSSAITILTGVLAHGTLSVGDNAYAAQKKVALFQHKTEALLKRGYVKLSGEDAVEFLVGNSVVIKKTDKPKGFPANDFDHRYYFTDRHTAYECVANDCWTQPWKVDREEICFEVPSVLCDSPAHRLYVAPRLFRSPHPDGRTGKIGIYLTSELIPHAVVKGNATITPLVDPNGAGKMIQVNSADLAQGISAVSEFSGGDKKAPIVGTRAIPFLIGNTFISGETVTDEHGDVRLCPVQGYYYSPDGRIITFNCHHEQDRPDTWSMHMTHWKLASGRLCVEDLSGDGKFGCGDDFERVYLTPSDHPNEWLVVAEDFPRKTVGYAGNIFNFK